MTKAFDRHLFYDRVRAAPFDGLTAPQVAGCEAILDECERRGIGDARIVAYLFATAFWETGRTMRPVREVGEGRGHAYGIRDPVTGQAYYGRGLVQLTWKANYARMAELCQADLVARPDLALDVDLAVKIMFEGMTRGLFTGRKLADYFDADQTNWVDARRIINGSDRADTVASIARQFHAALMASSLAVPAIAAAAPSTPAPPSQTFARRLKSLFGLTA